MDDLEREMRLLPSLARQPFTVLIPQEPHLIRDHAGCPAGAMHRMVPGTPLSTRGTPRGAARIDLLRDIGEFLSVLHATRTTAAKRHGAREIDLWSERYANLIAEVVPLLRPKTRDWLEDLGAAFAEAGGSRRAPRVLIHGDISGDHLLLDDGGALSGVIDSADAMIADPALDFAGILNHLTWRDLEQIWMRYTGTIDADVVRRTQFYITVAPVFSVLYGEIGAGPEERLRGIRRLTARAAAASRG